MQRMNKFYYDTGVIRYQNKRVEMGPPKCFYFTSPEDPEFKRAVISYVSPSSVCQDLNPLELLELRREISEEQQLEHAIEDSLG